MCAILVYVDDLLITGDDTACIEELKQALDTEFTTKDLGEMRFFLGLGVSRTTQGTLLNQRKYIKELVRDAGLETCKEWSSPFPQHVKLSTHEGEVMEEPEKYRRIIGRLLYLNISRPDIS